MKKIFSALCFALFGVTAIMTSCSDVPAPYDIFGDGGDKGDGGEITEDNPFGLDLSNPVADFKADFEEQPDFTQDGEYSSNLNYDYTLEGWKNIASVGDRTWTGVVYKDNTKYIQASANKGSAEKYEAWFISPAFKVDEIKDKAVSFDCSGAYFNEKNSLKVYFLTLEDEKMVKTEVAVTGIPTSGSNYVWAKGLTADLSIFAGKTGCIGFCYNSYSANSTTYQLDNIKPGKGEGGSEGGETTEGNPFGLDPNNIQNSFSADFSDITNNQDYELAGWKNISVKGERRWQGKTFNKTDKYIQATSYNGSGSEFECWFITPGFKVDEIEGKAISFDCAVYNYATAANNSKLEVYFLMLTDGNMTSEKIDIAGMPTTDNTWVTLSAPLSNFAGKTGYLGFKYTSTSSTEALSYRLDNIKAGANEGGETTEDDPFGLDASNPVTTFTADFEDITDPNQPYEKAGWTNKALQKGSVWQTATFNNNADKYIKINTYNTQANDQIESWFITPAFKVSAQSKLTFDCAGANWSSDMHLKVFFIQKGTDGKLTKEEITVNEIPTSGTNYTWIKDININLTSHNSKTGFIGFQYTMTSTGSGSGLPTYQIDNIKLSSDDEGTVDPTPDGEYTSNITLPESTSPDTNKASGGTVNINGQEYPILKLGTSSATGKWESSTLAEGNMTLSFYAVGWGGKTGEKLTITIKNGGSFNDDQTSQTIDLIPNEGATGNSPFTMNPTENDFKTFTLKNITATSTIEFSTEQATGDKRAILFGINIK